MKTLYNKVKIVEETEERIGFTAKAVSTILKTAGHVTVNITKVHLEKDFSHTDFANGSIVIGSLPANAVIEKAVILVETPFDGNVQLTIGTETSQGILVTVSNTELNYDCGYEVSNYLKLNTITEIKAFLLGTPTQGSGTILIYYS